MVKTHIYRYRSNPNVSVARIRMTILIQKLQQTELKRSMGWRGPQSPQYA